MCVCLCMCNSHPLNTFHIIILFHSTNTVTTTLSPIYSYNSSQYACLSVSFRLSISPLLALCPCPMFPFSLVMFFDNTTRQPGDGLHTSLNTRISAISLVYYLFSQGQLCFVCDGFLYGRRVLKSCERKKGFP